MTTNRLGIAAIVLILDTILLMLAGGTMWTEPSSPADEAVGKGLVTLGAVVGIAAFVLFCAFLNSDARVAPTREQARSDWDTL